jgi:ABC-type uncharacterized transport system substrate-binding protein
MGSLSHPTDTWRNEIGRAAQAQVSAVKPDIVFAAGDDAARYFVEPRADMPRKYIFLDLKGDPADYQLAAASNVTGVREGVPIRETFALMQQLAPQARGVAVLADRSLEADAVVRRIEQEEALALRVLIVQRAATLEEWRAALRNVQDKADVLCIAGYRSILAEPNGLEAVPPADLLRITAQENRLPDFSFWEDAVGPEGVLAAVTVPAAAQGRLAAKLAARILYYRQDIATVRIATCIERKTVVSAERAGHIGLTLPPALLGRPATGAPVSSGGR